jgi:pyruvate dehydrogenase E2 component (dihydrolipoamide acetyltransferase)
MPFTVTLPKLSPTMEDGTIAQWHKKEGEFVEAGEVLLEVSTDKATVEYNALDSGWLRKILVGDGQTALVNQPIAIFTEKKEESIEGYQPEGEAPVAAKPAAAALAPSTAAAAPVAPQPTPVAPQPAVQQPSATFAPAKPLEDYHHAFPTEARRGRVPASPLARKLASERGLDLGSVKGTGPNGRVMSRDLKLSQPLQAVGFTPQELPETPPGTYEEHSLSQIRRASARRLLEAKTFIPHFYVTIELDAEPVFEMREQLKAGGVHVTFNDIVVRATALSLREHPNVNTGFNPVNQSIIYFKTIDVSVAVGLPEGLITPIIRHADYKNLGEISVEMKDLSQRARDGKLKPEEFQGGSFTVSNLGMFGVKEFQAIINPPQAAILSVSGILDAPVVKKGQVVAGKVMHLSLSSDHRVVDGVAASKFLQTLKGFLENPSLLLLS